MQISATIPDELGALIQQMADKERRSFSQMVAVLLEQIVDKKKGKA